MTKRMTTKAKEESVRVRVSLADASAWRRAATRARKTLSQWLREIANGASSKGIATRDALGIVSFVCSLIIIVAVVTVARGRRSAQGNRSAEIHGNATASATVPTLIPDSVTGLGALGDRSAVLNAYAATWVDEDLAVIDRGVTVGVFHVHVDGDRIVHFEQTSGKPATLAIAPRVEAKRAAYPSDGVGADGVGFTGDAGRELLRATPNVSHCSLTQNGAMVCPMNLLGTP